MKHHIILTLWLTKLGYNTNIKIITRKKVLFWFKIQYTKPWRDTFFVYRFRMPITAAARSKAWNAFARSTTGIVGSNPIRGMDVCLCVCVVLCRWRPCDGLSTCPRSPTNCPWDPQYKINFDRNRPEGLIRKGSKRKFRISLSELIKKTLGQTHVKWSTSVGRPFCVFLSAVLLSNEPDALMRFSHKQ
jgi:hypothetical protein